MRVTLGLRPKDYVYLLLRAQAIYNGLLANAATLFPNPSPALPVLFALITAYDLAQQATITRAKGTIATRNLKAGLLITGLESEENMVQGLCDANPESAMVYIDGAGMFLWAVGAHPKELMAAELVPATSGLVQLDANASMLVNGSSKRPTFNWQMSPDGGKTITNLQSTPHSTTQVPNVPLLANAYFRVSVTLGKVTGEWSQWVVVFVH